MEMHFSASVRVLLSLASVVVNHLLEVHGETSEQWRFQVIVDEPEEWQGEKLRLADVRYLLHNDQELYLPVRVQVKEVKSESDGPVRWVGTMASVNINGYLFQCHFDPNTGGVIPVTLMAKFPYEHLKGKTKL